MLTRLIRAGSVSLSFALLALLLLAVVQAQSETIGEAPQLAARVAAGELPPVEERLPGNPLVVPVVERIGDYGGEWRSALRGAGDTGWLQKTVVYDNLVRWDPEWTEVIPDVAEAVEVNENASEFTFSLREGLRWSDGHPFTADDILFWYEDIIMNREVLPSVPAWLTSEGEPVVVEKVDDYTVTFRFVGPNSLFLQRLATPSGTEITGTPRHYLERFHARYNPDGIDELVAESGHADWGTLLNHTRWRMGNAELPSLHGWVFTSPIGDATTRVVAERNPYYWKVDPEGNQLPYLDRIVYNIVEDTQVLVLNTLNGDLDMIDRHVATLENRAVFFDNQERGDYRFFETQPALMNTMVIALNLNHQAPIMRDIFQNKDFRIGLSHALDRQEVIDLVYVGQGEPWQVAPPPGSPYYHERLATQYLEHDLDLANEYLDRAGFTQRDAQDFRLGPDGNRITFAVEVIPDFRSEWVDVLELVQLQWQEVGIDMHIRTMDRSLFYERKAANQHDANIWQGDGGLDALLEPRWYFPFSGESNFAPAWQAWYNDPSGVGATTRPEEPPAATRRQMELYDAIRSTADADEQAALMQEILDIAADEFYVIGLSLPAQGYGMVRNHFRNVPEVMPDAFLYPHPAPTNPVQYFIEGGAR